MSTNSKLKYLHELIATNNVGIDPVSSLQVLEDLYPSQVLQICIQLARQFLPLFEHYTPSSRNQWARLGLNKIQKGHSLDDMIWDSPFGLPFRPSSDIEMALMSFYEGMVFLSIAFEVQNDLQTFVRKAALSIFHLIVALSGEFGGTRYARFWNYQRDQNNVEELWLSPRTVPEVTAYDTSLWLNVADQIEIYLIQNTKISQAR